MKKIIVAGSRGFEDRALLFSKMDSLLKNIAAQGITIISGTAAGADRLGEQYAHERGYALTKMPAQWDKFGKSAGYKRNEQMAAVADCAVIFWDGESRGSGHMIDIMRKVGKPYRVVLTHQKGESK